jgi:hypothetical protein
MAGEGSLSVEANRGRRAQALIEDDLLAGAFKGLEEAYTAAWRNTTIDDVAAREKLFLAINIVGKVRDHLTSVVNNGKLAAAELKQLADTAERRKPWHEIR